MSEINIKVNGKNIPLSEFPSEFIINSVCGMLRTLKGVKDIKKVEINFKL